MALVPKSAQPAPQPKAVVSEPAKTVQKAAPAAPKTAPASGWQVQLAASRAATAAKAEGERLKKKHADVLGGMTVKIVRADLGAKGVFYRIRLGYAADKNKAREICTALSKRGQGCLVVAPGK